HRGAQPAPRCPRPAAQQLCAGAPGNRSAGNPLPGGRVRDGIRGRRARLVISASFGAFSSASASAWTTKYVASYDASTGRHRDIPLKLFEAKKHQAWPLLLEQRFRPCLDECPLHEGDSFAGSDENGGAAAKGAIAKPLRATIVKLVVLEGNTLGWQDPRNRRR